jgi:hypothetical protein
LEFDYPKEREAEIVAQEGEVDRVCREAGVLAGKIRSIASKVSHGRGQHPPAHSRRALIGRGVAEKDACAPRSV